MASTTSAGNTPSQRVRQLWRAFEQWQAPKRAEMQRQCNLSSNSRAQRQEIEERHYLTARQEWQRRLASAGLKDQDWGNMSATETKAVELALGGGDGAGSSASNGDQEAATSSMSLVPHAYASTPASHPSTLLQPPQIGSSFSTSSAASGFSSGYEVVNPSEFVSDDEDEDGNDEGGDGFLFQVAVVTAQHEIRSASASEDEGHKSYLGQTTSASSGHYGTGYNVTSPTSTTNQWRPYETPSYHHWSSSESSSQHPSANASPAQPPSMAIYSSSAMTGMSSITTSASTASSATAKAIPSTSTSSGWGATASALSSATTSAYAAVSSMSLFGTSPPEAGTTQTSKPKASSSSKPSSSASASASASALVPVSAFSSSTNRGSSQTKGVSASNSISASSSTSSTNPSSMAIVTRQATPPYIGPILSDSGDDDHDEHVGSQYDPDEAELDFKKFKTRTRMDKIIEFHREAAELEVRLVVEIERMRAASDLPPQAEKRLIEGHHAQMRALQQSKEMERQRIVKDERRRRRRALTVASASSSTSSLSLALVPQWNPNQGHPRSVRTGKLRNTEWLNSYEKVSTDFEVSMPGGFEFDEEPATVSYDHQHQQPSPSSSSPYQYGYPHQQQNQFGSPYADLPTPQGAHSGGSFQQQQQQQQQPQNGQYWSPPGAQTFSPPSSSPASSSNNASPSSFRDFAPLAGSNGGSNLHGRGSALQGHTLLQPPRPPTQSPRIARPRPMPAWNPQQLEMSAEEDEGEDGHENQQEYDWGSEPGYERGYASGQGQGRGYEGQPSYDSGAEDHSQWNGAYGNHHAQQQQQVYEHTPPSMYETIQMSSDSFHEDDAYAGHMQNGFGGAGGGDYFGTEEIPDELRAAMGGFTSFGQGQYSPPSNREQTVTNAREEQRREQQLPQRKGLPINTKRRSSDFVREEKKSMPGSVKNGNGDALNSSTNTVNGGVMNKTPTTTSPLASFIPSKLNNLGFGSLWGGRGGASQDDSRQVKEVEEEEEESDEEEEDDEEETWSTSPPQKKQAPAPPPKKAAPPPPAPAPTTAKGRKAAAALAKAQAAAQAKAQAEEDAKVAAAAKAAEEAENERKAAEAARESKAAPPVPEKATAGGKKQTKKQKQAAAKKGGNAKGEVPSSPVEEKKKAPASPVNAKDNKPPVELETTRKMSSSSFLSSSVLSTGSEGGWEEASSTPRPSAATIKVQPGWGSKNQQQQDVLGSTKQGGMLRKQTVVQQAQQQQEMSGTNGKVNASGGLVIDNSPLPDDVAQARWGRLSQKPAATPVSAATPTAPSPAASAGWKVGGKARRNSDGGKDALESSAAQNGFARVSNGSGSARKARNGFSSAPKKVTIEEVSDEEADIVVDGNLGVESRYLLESTEEIEREQHELQHPRPSMPPSSYSNIIGAGEHYDDGFPSSANSSFGPPTPSTAPTSPPDDVPPEDFFSSATTSLKMQHSTRGQGGGHSSSASGFASDFDATIRQRPRWSTMGNKRPASSATVGAGAGGSMQSLFRHKAIPMAAPTSSSESDELTSPMGAIPGGFPSTARGNVNAGNAAGRGGDLQKMKEQMRAAALASGARPTTSTSNVSSAVGGPRQIEETSPADNARVERFLQAQRQEALKRGGR